MWTNIIIWCLIFVSVTCGRNDILKLSESTNPSDIHTHMSQLLELCYSNVSNPIVMTPNLVDTVYRNPSNTLTAPIIILDDNFVAKDIQLYYPTYPTYVLSVDTYKQLGDLIRKIKQSPSWNIASVFYVIVNTGQSCKDSLQSTWVLWSFGCLSSFVICKGISNKTMLVTLNPFTHRAAFPWIDQKISIPGQRFAFYAQPFINDKIICESLNFDKTKSLDGYYAKVTKIIRYKDYLQMLVFPSLNVTPLVTDIGFWQTESLASGENDISETRFSIDTAYKKSLEVVSGISESSYAIVTQKRSFLSLLNQIINVFDVDGIIALIIILILFIILIILGNEYQIVPAFMDVFKWLLRMNMDFPLNQLFMKIILFTALLFVFMFSPAIDAQLFAVLTHPPSFDVETLQDLHDHQYHVYYHSSLHGDMLREEIWTTVEDMKYLHPISNPLSLGYCLELAKKDKTVACIDNEYSILHRAHKQNLHVSKNFVFKTNFAYLTRKDWALKKRVDQQVLRATESGFFEKEYRRPFQNILKKMKAKERIKKILNCDELDAIDLKYAYIFFAFIQFLSIIVFGVEHIIARWLRPRQ